jgi:excisionase family DNA binding protein
VAQTLTGQHLHAQAGTDTPADGDLLCGVSQADCARLLGVSTKTVERMRKDGQIRSVMVRGKVIVPMSEIKRVLDIS